MEETQPVKGLGSYYPRPNPGKIQNYPMDTLKRLTNKDGEECLLFNPVLEHSHLMGAALRSFTDRHDAGLPLIGPDEPLLEYICHWIGFEEAARFTGYSVAEINNFFCKFEEAN